MTAWLEQLCFNNRRLWLVLWVIVTVAAAFSASNLTINASFEKCTSTASLYTDLAEIRGLCHGC